MKRAFVIGGVLLTAIVALGGWLWLPSQLPASAGASTHSLKLSDRHGALLRDVPASSGQRDAYLALESVPLGLRRAVILAEDRRYYRHGGVDPLALGRALWQGLVHGRVVSGASTLSMQAVRLAFGIDRSFAGKLKQIAYALKIDGAVSKGEILEYYLNHVPFGGTVTGVGLACRVYFDRDCNRLSTAQMATLAVLPRAPNAMLADTERLGARRDRLLARMFEAGLLDREAHTLARAEAVALTIHRPGFHAPHFTERVRAALNAAASGPVRTSLDMALQREVQGLSRHYVDALRERHVNAAAVLVVDNRNGEVLAYVGSPDYFDDANHGKVDYVQTRRQPGSTMKPFTYALALQSGSTLATLVPDLPLVFSTQAGPYRPKNYGETFSGPRRIREALANSLNVPALHTAIGLGDARLLTWYRRLGFNSLDKDAAYYGPGLTLGNGEVSLWELVNAYVTLARGGNAIELRVLRAGRAPPTGRQLIEPRAAYLIADALKDPLAREGEFGRYNALSFPFPVAAKTGTSTDFRDNWVVGFTREVTVGVWVGNEQNKPMKHVTGVSGAGPLFHQVMIAAGKLRAPRWIAPPKGLVTRRICPLSGRLAGPHCDGDYIEHFRREHAPTGLCPFHGEVLVRDCRGRDRHIQYVNLPSLYRDWQAHTRLHALPDAIAAGCGDAQATALRVDGAARPPVRGGILEPRDGSFYALDPTIPRVYQQMALRLLVPDRVRHTEILVNGRRTRLEAVQPGLYLWPMTRGSHSFSARFRLADGPVVETEDVRIRVF